MECLPPRRLIAWERRRAERLTCARFCSYLMSEVLDDSSVLIQEGEAIVLNVSIGGMLLLMTEEPREKQLLEIYLPSYSMALVESCWSRSRTVEMSGRIFLLGVRFLFGPCALADRQDGNAGIE